MKVLQKKERESVTLGNGCCKKMNFVLKIVQNIIKEKYTEYIQIWRNIGERVVKDHQRSHSVQPRMKKENSIVKMLEKAPEARAACRPPAFPSLLQEPPSLRRSTAH